MDEDKKEKRVEPMREEIVEIEAKQEKKLKFVPTEEQLDRFQINEEKFLRIQKLLQAIRNLPSFSGKEVCFLLFGHTGRGKTAFMNTLFMSLGLLDKKGFLRKLSAVNNVGLYSGKEAEEHQQKRYEHAKLAFFKCRSSDSAGGGVENLTYRECREMQKCLQDYEPCGHCHTTGHLEFTWKPLAEDVNVYDLAGEENKDEKTGRDSCFKNFLRWLNEPGNENPDGQKGEGEKDIKKSAVNDLDAFLNGGASKNRLMSLFGNWGKPKFRIVSANSGKKQVIAGIIIVEKMPGRSESLTSVEKRMKYVNRLVKKAKDYSYSPFVVFTHKDEIPRKRVENKQLFYYHYQSNDEISQFLTDRIKTADFRMMSNRKHECAPGWLETIENHIERVKPMLEDKSKEISEKLFPSKTVTRSLDILEQVLDSVINTEGRRVSVTKWDTICSFNFCFWMMLVVVIFVVIIYFVFKHFER